MKELMKLLPSIAISVTIWLIDWYKIVKEKNEKNRKKFFWIKLSVTLIFMSIPFIMGLISKAKK